MKIPKVERLDLGNPKDVAEYEEAFYRAFLPLSNPAIRELWIWDDESKRLRTRIPYEEQVIFYVRDADGVIKTAGAFNIGEREFQSLVYGFPFPPAHEKWIEILTLFSGAGAINKLFVLEEARRTLGALGFNASYATSAERVVTLHTKLGAEIIGRTVYDGQVRLLIRSGFDRPFVKSN